MCNPCFLWASIPAFPFIKTAAVADSSGSRFFDNIAATTPESTSPVPPTVIAGVFFTFRYVFCPSLTMSVGPFSNIVRPFSLACFSTVEILSFLESEGSSTNNLLNSPACGVTITFLFLIIGKISCTKALASRDNLTSFFKSEVTSNFNASMSCIVKPIPIVAESRSFGMTPRSLCTAPLVSFESTRGSTIRFGDIALVACTFIFGTQVYTKSVPHRSAASDESIGAP